MLVLLGLVAGIPQPSMAGVTVKTIVLVHGAFADGSSWSKVISLLEAKGFNVIAVQNPLTSFADDVAATSRVLAFQEAPVLLVGHSYAGAVITEMGDDPNVAGLLYVAAYAPDVGEAVADIGKGLCGTPGAAQITADKSGFLSLTRQGIDEDFAPELTPAQRSVVFATQGQTAAAAFGAKITNAAWKSKPSWCVVAGKDRMISPQYEQAAGEKIRAMTITIASGHTVMAPSHPRELAAFIEGGQSRREVGGGVGCTRRGSALKEFR